MQNSIKDTLMYGLVAVLLAGCNVQTIVPAATTAQVTVPIATPIVAPATVPRVVSPLPVTTQFIAPTAPIATATAVTTISPDITITDAWLTYTDPVGISFRYPPDWHLQNFGSEGPRGIFFVSPKTGAHDQTIRLDIGHRQDGELNGWDGQISLFGRDNLPYLRWVHEIERPNMRGVVYVAGPPREARESETSSPSEALRATLLNRAPNANNSGYYLAFSMPIGQQDLDDAKQLGIEQIVRERYRIFEAIVESARFPEETGAPVNAPELQASEPSINPYGKSLIISGSHQIEFDDDVMQVHLAPNQRAFAVYTSGSSKTVGQQTLYVYSFPELELLYKQPLLATEMVNSLRDSGTMQEQLRNPYAAVLYSIYHTGGKQTWSPDGRYFAFAAAFEGPSADLYVFDTELGMATRLTDGPSQIGGVGWSLDSQWVVHQAIGGFEDSPGWSVDGVWAAPVNGDVARLLIRDPQQTPYRIVTWVSDQAFLAMPLRQSDHDNLEYVPIAEPTARRRIFELPGNLNAVQYHAETQRIDVVAVRQEGSSQHWSLWSVSLDGGTSEKLKETVNEEIALPK